MSVKKGKLIVLTSVKGGVGKTTTTLNLAGILTNKKISTLLIDLDLYSGGIAASLDIDNEKDIYKLVDDMYNNRFTNIENYVVKYNEYIDVIPSPKDPRFASKINGKYLSVILSKCSMKYDVILIDTNHLLNEINLITMDYVDEIIYLISNDPIDLKNMKSMVSILKDMEKDNYKIVLNESINKLNHYFNNYDIKNIIKSNIDYIIPNSFNLKNINRYVIDGKIITLDPKIQKMHSKVIKTYNDIIDDILKK